MSDLPEVFKKYASNILESYSELNYLWTKNNLKIYKQNNDGFDVAVEAETYGLYAFAYPEKTSGMWHSIPREIGNTDTTYEELCEDFMGFIRSLLCEDSWLEVRFANSTPYKWILNYPTESGRELEETGAIFFNYFGKRSSKIYKNCHLPKRYAI